MKEQPKKQIITIAGRPGSGKSSTAKLVAQKLGFEHFSSGDLFRQIANEMKIDLLHANISAEENVEIDHRIDGRLRDIGQHEDRKVIDSRTAWHWMPSSFKVFLNLDLETAASRILGGMDDARLESEHIHRDPKEYAQILRKRLDSENKRYKKLYDINPYDLSNYDLVIDSGSHNLEQVVGQILEGYRSWREES